MRRQLSNTPADEIITTGRRRHRLVPKRCDQVHQGILTEIEALYHRPYFKHSFRQNEAGFPALSVPQHYREEICALAIGVNVKHFLQTPQWCLNYLSLWQVIQNRDWARLEEGLNYLRDQRLRELKVEENDNARTKKLA